MSADAMHKPTFLDNYEQFVKGVAVGDADTVQQWIADTAGKALDHSLWFGLDQGSLQPHVWDQIFSALGAYLRTPLVLAARLGHFKVVQVLIAAGAPAEYDCNVSVLSPMVEASKGGHISILQMLLTAGADPDTADGYANTSLKAAAWGGHIGCVHVLLAAGAAPWHPKAGLLLNAVNTRNTDVLGALLASSNYGPGGVFAADPALGFGVLRASVCASHIPTVHLLLDTAALSDFCVSSVQGSIP